MVAEMKDEPGRVVRAVPEATQGQMHGFFSQLSYNCHLEEVAFVGDS